MSDGFVNLQAELRAIENDGALAFGTLRGGMQRDAFFADALRIAGRSSDSTSSYPCSMCCPPKLFGYERFWISVPAKLVATIPAPDCILIW